MVVINFAIRRLRSHAVACLTHPFTVFASALCVVFVMPPVMASEQETLDRDIAKIQSDVASLSQTLFELEESILHPSDTQTAIFLTLKDKDGLELDSIELFVDGTPVASHLYTDQERDSLRKGGVQRLYTGNLRHGTHKLKAIITASSANERFIRRELRHDFQKRPGETRIQMSLDAAAPDYEPVVSFQEWK